MKAAVVFLIFLFGLMLALFGADTQSGDPRINSNDPPARFRAANGAPVIFTRVAHEMCAPFSPWIGPNTRINACTIRNRVTGAVIVVFLPHPCDFRSEGFFAFAACHELGHVNGWSGEHED